MSKTNTLHIRIEPEVKTEVEETLRQLGLSTADAVNIFFRQIMLNGGLPFAVKIPKYNIETLEAMKESKEISKSGQGFDSPEEMFRKLDI